MQPIKNEKVCCCFPVNKKPNLPKLNLKNIMPKTPEKKAPTHLRTRTWQLHQGKMRYEQQIDEDTSTTPNATPNTEKPKNNQDTVN